MEQHALVDSKHWTVRKNEESIVHEELLGKGGFGEVHRVILS